MSSAVVQGEIRIRANGIELACESIGSARAQPLLLISGLGAQMISWDEELCRQLAGRGYRLICFDNRDTGLSTKFDEAGSPDIGAMFRTQEKGGSIQAPYTLDDMAADAIALLDAFEIEEAHVLGASMGGMIAQTMAIQYPDRVRTLISLMSSTGDPDLPPPTPEAMRVLFRPLPTDRQGYIEARLDAWRVLSGPHLPMDEAVLRKRAEQFFERGVYPAGTARQFAAILASGSRKQALSSIQAPTLVIHGDADPLVPLECGIDTARSIPAARLVIIGGMGHSLPPAVWPQLIDEIVQHAV